MPPALKAAATRGITVIPEGQRSNCACRSSPLPRLNLAGEHAETFAIWGIRTLGELAALPEADLIARLGPASKGLARSCARRGAAHLSAHRARVLAEEFCEFETPVEQMDSLLFIGARMIDCLVARAAARALSLASLTVG